jgi:polyphosphate glucokinase
MKKRILVLDVGGTNVKVLLPGHKTPIKIPSGSGLNPREMVAAVKQAAAKARYDAITIGFPAAVVRGRILHEPHNLGRGWVRFDFEKAFGKPVKVINDAAMQALGSYEGGTMLFLGLGTGLGSALIVDGALAPLELAHVPYRSGEYEDYVGLRGYKKYGKRKWRKLVREVVRVLRAGLVADYVVLGGGQTKLLKKLPDGCRLGDNLNAFVGGQRVWDEAARRPQPRRRSVKQAAPQSESAPVEVPAAELEPAPVPEGDGQ